MLLANAKGMSSVDALLRDSAAMDTMIGIISATVPVLLTKAPMNAVTSITSMNNKASLPLAKCIILWLAALASPVCNIAPPTTNSPTIITTTGLENPANASVGVRMPQSSITTNEHRATMSALSRPATNIATVTMSMIIVNVMWKRFCKRAQWEFTLKLPSAAKFYTKIQRYSLPSKLFIDYCGILCILFNFKEYAFELFS